MKFLKFLGLSILTASFLSFTPLNKKIIVLDAGHGGADIGTQRENVYEKDIALKVVQQIAKLNQNSDTYEIILTRNTDENVPLSSRTEKINELHPAAVISLHVNSSSKPESERSGHEIYTQATEESKNLAKVISGTLGDCSIREMNLHILRESKSPAVLVELGFMNSTKDRKYLSSEKGQKEIAEKFNKIFKEL